MRIAKRKEAAGAFYATGLCALTMRLARRPLLLVLNYHRIGNPAGNDFDDGVFSAAPDLFRAQVAFLSRHFRILSMAELMDYEGNGFDFDEPCAMITFDDGYRDNYELACPILCEMGVPATFFVPTGYVSEPRLSWWDRIAYVVKQTRQSKLVLQQPGPLTIDFSKLSRGDAVKILLRLFKAKQMDTEKFFAHLEDRAAVSVNTAALAKELFMTWDHVASMSKAGMDIGSHTHNHEILAHHNSEEQHRQMIVSRDMLQDKLGREIVALSYPVGKKDLHFTAETKRMAEEVGYRVAFSFYGGVNRPKSVDAYDIHRVGVDLDDTYAMYCVDVVLNSAFGRSF